MKIIIEAEPKEIADLVSLLQSQRIDVDLVCNKLIQKMNELNLDSMFG